MNDMREHRPGNVQGERTDTRRTQASPGKVTLASRLPGPGPGTWAAGPQGVATPPQEAPDGTSVQRNTLSQEARQAEITRWEPAALRGIDPEANQPVPLVSAARQAAGRAESAAGQDLVGRGVATQQGHLPGCGCGQCATGYGSKDGNAGTDEDGPVGVIEAAAEGGDTPPAPTKTEERTAPGPTEPGPTITSATSKAAPSGAANTRTRVGVGEQVVFTGSAAGTWAASAGTPATGASATTFTWTAPATAGSVTITLTVGSARATKTMTVVAPTSIAMANIGSHSSLVGPGGACMKCSVTYNPLDVCLGATQWFEEPGPATNITGFFTKYDATAILYHHPNPSYLTMGDDNKLEGYDHAAWHTTSGPYSAGTFQWDIPTKYKVDGEDDSAGRVITTITQLFTMNAAGNLTITKGGAST